MEGARGPSSALPPPPNARSRPLTLVYGTSRTLSCSRSGPTRGFLGRLRFHEDGVKMGVLSPQCPGAPCRRSPRRCSRRSGPCGRSGRGGLGPGCGCDGGGGTVRPGPWRRSQAGCRGGVGGASLSPPFWAGPRSRVSAQRSELWDGRGWGSVRVTRPHSDVGATIEVAKSKSKPCGACLCCQQPFSRLPSSVRTGCRTPRTPGSPASGAARRDGSCASSIAASAGGSGRTPWGRACRGAGGRSPRARS